MILASTGNGATPENSSLKVERVEHKYLISAAQALRIRNLLQTAMDADPHNAAGGYLVRSLYFDTRDDRDYYAKLDGIYLRQKIRLRVYSINARTAKLECKLKHGDFQQKYSLLLSRAESEALCAGDISFLQSRSEPEAKFFYLQFRRGYRPSVLIDYRRYAFSWPVGNTRITVDSRVQGCENHRNIFSETVPFHNILPGNQSVLEVKYAGTLEPFLARLLSNEHLTQTSYSKYENSRFLLHLL